MPFRFFHLPHSHTDKPVAPVSKPAVPSAKPPARFDEHLALAWTLLKWGVLGAWVGVLSGSASAGFLAALDWATNARQEHGWLLWLLPLGGMMVGGLYHAWGKSVEAGNNLLLERIHNPDDPVPLRMAPLILIGTVVTHLFGGSAGREGTAVQMGGALANLVGKPLRLSRQEHRLLLMAGISGGFGSVFGTPLAGTVFGLEVSVVGRISYEGLVPCFVAATVGDVVCRAWGIHHYAYPILAMPPVTFALWAWIALASVGFGLVSLLFAELIHAVSRIAKAKIAVSWLRPFVGGVLVIALTYLVGTRDYLGLSLPLIVRSVTTGDVASSAWAWKLAFTALTLGTGFKGGEVTPLFCIGATLGAAFAHLTGQPPVFFAALGFVAVFAGAANTPLACAIMGIELFGSALAVPLAAACIISYVVSGHRGIYLSQRIGASKSHIIQLENDAPLREARGGKTQIHLPRALLRFTPQPPVPKEGNAADEGPTS